MSTQTIFKSILFLSIFTFTGVLNIFAGEYPRTLTAYLGKTPVLDGFISEGEYADAEWLTGLAGWHSDTNGGVSCEDSLDLSVKVWYKHDGTYLYFAFDVTDNIMYGFDTERWLPDRNENANNLEFGEGGWPWWGDGLEIMMNPSYTWDETKKSVGDGTIWQTICNTHKSYAGGLEYGGLIQGVPLNEYAWTNYENWYDNESMKASVRVKTEEEGSGYVVEWRISPNPCMQKEDNSFVDLSVENMVGINFEFEDVDKPEDGLGSGNLTQFRHVDYMTKLPDYRKNIAKGFATLVLTPEKMNPDSLSTSISEDYESSLSLPTSHSVVVGTENEIGVQAGECGNNNLVISKLSPIEAAEAIVSFLWMDEMVYSSFDITPEQTGSDIQFNLMSEEKSLVKIGFENDSIRYYQNGIGTAWKAYELNSKYRIQIEADLGSKKYALNVNGDMLTELDFNDSTGSVINGFNILSMAEAPVGSFLFDNLIIQDEAIEASDLYPIENCWELAYNYEGSLDLPSNHIVTAESSADVFVDFSSFCDNNSLLITDSSSNYSTMVEVPFAKASSLVHVQFNVVARQDTGSINFDLREGDLSLVKVALNSSGKISYYDNESTVDWLNYETNTKYSIQLIANSQTKSYEFIVNSDTLKDIAFYENTVTMIDNVSLYSPVPSVGDFKVDNLVISNRLLSELLLPFDSCVEVIIDPVGIEAHKQQINIYPNPTAGVLSIELGVPHPNPIIVTDIFGREIYRKPGTMDKKIELVLPDTAPGLYLINFDTEQGRFSRQIQLIN